MSKLPPLRAKEAIKAFGKIGFLHEHTRGSHYILRRPTDKRKLVVPLHGPKTLGKGLLLSLIRDANLTKEEFIQLL